MRLLLELVGQRADSRVIEIDPGDLISIEISGIVLHLTPLDDEDIILHLDDLLERVQDAQN